MNALESAPDDQSYGSCRYSVQILGLISCILMSRGALRPSKGIFNENHHGRFVGLGSLRDLQILQSSNLLCYLSMLSVLWER